LSPGWAVVNDVLGWAGAGLLLGACGLVSTKELQGYSAAYQLLNLAGSAFLIVNSAYYGTFPSVGVNVVWIGIVTLAISRALR